MDYLLVLAVALDFLFLLCFTKSEGISVLDVLATFDLTIANMYFKYREKHLIMHKVG